MKNRIYSIFKKPFVRNVVTLASGTIAAQTFNIIFSPLITRLYGPTAYGLMGSFQAIIAILFPISSLSFEMAIVIPDEENEAKEITKLSLITTTLISILVLFIIIVFREQIVTYMDFTKFSKYLYLLPFITFFSGLYLIMEQWAIRKDQYRHISIAAVSEASIRNLSEIGLGFIHPTADILLIFRSIQYFLKFLFMCITTKSNILIKSLTKKADLKIIAKKYKDFPLYRAPEVFINSISGSIPIIMLTTFFGPSSAGYFSIGRTVLGIPTILLSKSIGDVFFSRVSKGANNRERLFPMLLRSTIILALVGLIPYGIIIIFGQPLFSLIFGSSWRTAGLYAQWMALWSYVVFSNKPSVMILPVIKEQRFQLIFTVTMLISRVVALYIGFIMFKSDIVAIALFGISGAIFNVFLISITMLKTKRFDKSNLK